SLDTARGLMRYQPGEVTYLVAKCRDPADAERVARRLDDPGRMTALTADEFSAKSRLHWLTTTKAGVAIGFTALLGLLVGGVVAVGSGLAALRSVQGVDPAHNIRRLVWWHRPLACANLHRPEACATRPRTKGIRVRESALDPTGVGAGGAPPGGTGRGRRVVA